MSGTSAVSILPSPLSSVRLTTTGVECASDGACAWNFLAITIAGASTLAAPMTRNSENPGENEDPAQSTDVNRARRTFGTFGTARVNGATLPGTPVSTGNVSLTNSGVPCESKSVKRPEHWNSSD